MAIQLAEIVIGMRRCCWVGLEDFWFLLWSIRNGVDCGWNGGRFTAKCC